jgi:serine/threonine protein kinase
VHEERIINRNIKPENFQNGATETTKNNVYIIDFGLEKRYKTSEGEHIPFKKDGKNFTGTAINASLNTHRLRVVSKRPYREY